MCGIRLWPLNPSTTLFKSAALVSFKLLCSKNMGIYIISSYLFQPNWNPVCVNKVNLLHNVLLVFFFFICGSFLYVQLRKVSASLLPQQLRAVKCIWLVECINQIHLINWSVASVSSSIKAEVLLVRSIWVCVNMMPQSFQVWPSQPPKGQMEGLPGEGSCL